jgi:hypothetical protein
MIIDNIIHHCLYSKSGIVTAQFRELPNIEEWHEMKRLCSQAGIFVTYYPAKCYYLCVFTVNFNVHSN